MTPENEKRRLSRAAPLAHFDAANGSTGSRRSTGLQAYIKLFDAQLEAGRDQLDTRDYAVMLDIVGRRLDAERERQAFAIRRWAA